MSEPQKDTDTVPTFGDWDWSPQDGPAGHCIQAQVWGPLGHSIVAVDSRDGEEVANDRARFIAAAGTAAHELPDEYDPVAALGVLPDLIQHADDLMPLLKVQSSIDHTTLQDLLQKARRDDE